MQEMTQPIPPDCPPLQPYQLDDALACRVPNFGQRPISRAIGVVEHRSLSHFYVIALPRRSRTTTGAVKIRPGHHFLGACPSNGRDCDGSEMSRMRGGGSSRLLIMSLRDPTTKQAGHFRPTPQGGVLFGPRLRRGSSEYHPCQVRHRRRYLMGAKNHAVATRRLLGQAPRQKVKESGTN